MIIECKVKNYTEETKKIEIKDPKNVFLKGTDSYDDLQKTYLGIWTNDKYLVVVNLIGDHLMNYEYSLSDYELPTECEIKHYLEHNENVVIISKDEFKNTLEKATSILKI